MHELSLMSGVIDVVREQAVAQGFTRVHRVRLAVGEACNAEPEALLFCFDVVARGTPAEGARLELATMDGRGISVTELEVE